jgi:hypothetical protein
MFLGWPLIEADCGRMFFPSELIPFCVFHMLSFFAAFDLSRLGNYPNQRLGPALVFGIVDAMSMEIRIN